MDTTPTPLTVSILDIAAMWLDYNVTSRTGGSLIPAHLLAGYRQVGDSSAPRSRWSSNITYNATLRVSRRYDANLLRPIPQSVCTMAKVEPQNLEYTVLLCPAQWRWWNWRGSPQWSAIISFQILLRGSYQCLFTFIFRSRFYRIEPNCFRSNFMSLDYCTPLERGRGRYWRAE